MGQGLARLHPPEAVGFPPNPFVVFAVLGAVVGGFGVRLVGFGEMIHRWRLVCGQVGLGLGDVGFGMFQ